MKKGIIVLAVFLAVISCSSSERIPMPGEITNTPFLGMGYTAGLLGGFGSVYDEYDTARPQLFRIDRDIYNVEKGSTFQMTVTVSQRSGKIYESFYISDKNNNWNEYKFDAAEKDSQGFISSYASKTVSLNSGNMKFMGDGYNYVLAYSCRKHGGIYRCGCSSSQDSQCNKFMVHYFELCDAAYHDNGNCGCTAGCAGCSGYITQANGCGQQRQVACANPPAITCGSGQQCVNGQCQQQCINQCAAGTTECVGNQIRECATNTNGCTTWERPHNCGTGQYCQNSQCQQIPTCTRTERCIGNDAGSIKEKCENGVWTAEKRCSIFCTDREDGTSICLFEY